MKNPLRQTPLEPLHGDPIGALEFSNGNHLRR